MTTAAGNSYGRIFKSTSLLGGSSLICVGLAMVRTKVLAVQLGPALFGLIGLYSALTTMVASICSLGLGQSAVREVAAAAAAGDQHTLSRQIRVLRRTVWMTGLLGMLVTLALAVPASWWTFKNLDHALPIAFLSVTVLISEIQAGQTALLQGLRRVRDLTLLNVFGAVWSTLLAVPILIYWGAKGIVLFLIAVALGQLTASWWYARQVQIPEIRVTWRDTWEQSRGMVALGLALMASGAAVSVSTYLIRLIIQAESGEVAVGLYQSAFALCGIYISFVLQAMSSDYYPRLTEAGADVDKRNQLVTEQAEMAILLALPGIVAALIFSDLLLWALYSRRFDGAAPVLRWIVLGLLGRIISWPLGYLLLARADKKAFVWTEVITAAVHVGLVIVGVRFFGVCGAGVAFAGQYLFYVVLISWTARRRHAYTPRPSTNRVILGALLITAAAFGTTFLPNLQWRLGIGLIIFASAATLSLLGVVERLVGSKSGVRASIAVGWSRLARLRG